MQSIFKKSIVSVVVVMCLVGQFVLPALAEDQIELRMAWWGSQNRHERTIKVIEMFEKVNPSIKIIYEFGGFGDHWTKLTTQAAGRNLPDIIQHAYPKLADWVSRDLLLPLDEYVESGVLDFSNVLDSALEGGRFDGKLYAMNLGNNSQAIVLDVDLFEKAGIELPAQNWSWQDFEAIVLKLHEKLGIYGIGVDMVNDHIWKSLYLGYGEWAYTDDGKALGYSNDQVLADYLNMLLRLQKAGAIATRAEEVAGGGGVENQAIVSGKAAMAYIWSNQIVALWKAAGADRNFVMTHLPRPADGCCPTNYVKPSQFFAITAHSQHPKEAAMFLNFFTNSVEANRVLMAERGVPISSVVKEALKPALEPAQVEAFEFLSRVEADSSPIRPADPAGHSDIVSNVYYPELIDPVLYEMVSAEDGVANFRKLASEILTK